MFKTNLLLLASNFLTSKKANLSPLTSHLFSSFITEKNKVSRKNVVINS